MLVVVMADQTNSRQFSGVSANTKATRLSPCLSVILTVSNHPSSFLLNVNPRKKQPVCQISSWSIPEMPLNGIIAPPHMGALFLVFHKPRFALDAYSGFTASLVGGVIAEYVATDEWYKLLEDC